MRTMHLDTLKRDNGREIKSIIDALEVKFALNFEVQITKDYNVTPDEEYFNVKFFRPFTIGATQVPRIYHRIINEEVKKFQKDLSQSIQAVQVVEDLVENADSTIALAVTVIKQRVNKEAEKLGHNPIWRILLRRIEKRIINKRKEIFK